MVRWILVLCAISFSNASANPWGEVQTPAPGPAKVYGSYSRGCFTGGQPVPNDGVGFQVMRLKRHRFFAHPNMYDFIEKFGAKVDRSPAGIAMMGDSSQPRGGPMKSGHASHQTGLDLDVWFWVPPQALERPLTDEERETEGALSMLTGKPLKINRDLWNHGHVEMLKLASEHPETQRIFVNPLIKKELCDTVTENREWLRKIRPWYGHDDHFHVRLRCPKDSKGCVGQEEPKGDGCDESLDWWLENGVSISVAEHEPEVVNPHGALPDQCKRVLDLTKK